MLSAQLPPMGTGEFRSGCNRRIKFFKHLLDDHKVGRVEMEIEALFKPFAQHFDF